MKKLISNHIQGKKVLLLFLLANLVYLILLLITVPKVMSFSGGMDLLDMRPIGYDTAYVKALFDQLGEEGRNAYLYNQIPVDMVYPLLFGISFCLVLAFFLNKLEKLRSPYIYLCLIPIVAGVADYLENISVIILLKSYPDLSNGLAAAASLFTIIKSGLITLYFVTLIIVVIAVGIRFYKKKIRSTSQSKTLHNEKE